MNDSMVFVYRPTSENEYLQHYGRLGMKWGKHIYGSVKTSNGSRKSSSNKKSSSSIKSKASRAVKAVKDDFNKPFRESVTKRTLAAVATAAAVSGTGVLIGKYAATALSAASGAAQSKAINNSKSGSSGSSSSSTSSTGNVSKEYQRELEFNSQSTNYHPDSSSSSSSGSSGSSSSSTSSTGNVSKEYQRELEFNSQSTNYHPDSSSSSASSSSSSSNDSGSATYTKAYTFTSENGKLSIKDITDEANENGYDVEEFYNYLRGN